MKVCELFQDETNWMQGAYSAYKLGKEIFQNNTEVCYCLAGAILKCYPGNVESANVMRKVAQALKTDSYSSGNAGSATITQWNDDPKRTIEEVRELVCRLDI